ncbi:maleylacetoacetate isomerase [Rhodospirillaceae bacterium SYSU D60014]|uniref:maleylacetoacetate isomerase n=1 Tax=Virgifigura deserti TaxID=2268457 RepID=UPI000E66ADC1
MELYTFFRSSTSYRVRIALAYKGLAYDPRFVSLPKMEHKRDDYLAVNPQGLVPALVDGGHVLSQSLAIIEYLDEVYPAPPLLPEDPFDRAYVRSLSQIVGCEIHPLNNVRVLKYLQGRWSFSDADRDEWYRHWIAEGLASLERSLLREQRHGAFCLGEEVTMADVCLVPQIFNARRFDCPLEDYPTVMRIFERCMTLDAFTAPRPNSQPDAV